MLNQACYDGSLSLDLSNRDSTLKAKENKVIKEKRGDSCRQVTFFARLIDIAILFTFLDADARVSGPFVNLSNDPWAPENTNAENTGTARFNHDGPNAQNALYNINASVYYMTSPFLGLLDKASEMWRATCSVLSKLPV